MRASFVVMVSKASAFCSLVLSASIAFGQKDSISEVSAEVLPLVTNLVQLREASSPEPNALYDVRLEGDVWWASAAQRKLVFKDTSGAEELDPGLNYQCFEGEWENLPDFNSLTPVKTGTCSGPDGKLRTRSNNSGLDGHGFSIVEHNKGMDGVSNMRARIEKLGGRFELQSERGQGTTLRFFVPLM